MPRPTPIIVPGPTGMGGSFKKTETNLQLDKIAELFGFIQDRMAKAQQAKAAEASGADMLKMLGMDQREVPQAPIQVDIPNVSPKAMAQASPTTTPDYSAMGQSKEGRDILSDIIKGSMGTGRGSTAAPHTVDIYDPKRKDTYRYQLDASGGMKELGLAPPKEFADKYNAQSDVAEHIKKKYGMDALQEWVYRMQIASNPTAGVITPPEQVMKDIDEKYGKSKKAGKESKVFTPALAGEYLKKYGSRAKAEEAAKKDGYTW